MLNHKDNSAALYLRKGEERRLRAGHDWIYSNEIDTARSPLKGLEPGQTVDILTQKGQWLARAYANPYSLIVARITSRDPGVSLDRPELERRLRAAAELRDRMYPANCYRWVYGESDNLPGLVVDRYGDFAVVQINTAGMERLRNEVVQALMAVAKLRGILLRCDSALRSLENLPDYVETAHGFVPEEVELVENGVAFLAPLLTGQKTGWFFDQADNRRRARPLLAADSVIDAFCYAGGWGVNAALAGARRVTFIDSSENALEYARRNAERNGVAARCAFLRSDVNRALDELAVSGAIAGANDAALIVDPPAFVKRKKDLRAGAAAYERLHQHALGLLSGGGFLVSCSCSQHVDRDSFLQLLQRGSVKAGRRMRLLCEGGQSADHPIHPAMPETRYLKALFLQVEPAATGPCP